MDGPNGEKAWLFGTIHSLPENVDWRTPVLERALDASDMLVVEVKDIGNSGKGAEVFHRLATDRKVPLFEQRLAADDMAIVQNAMHEAGTSMRQLDGYETWAAALILGQSADTFGSEPGADADLLRTANGKDIHELEGIERQLRIFNDLPDIEQQDLLLAVAREALDRDENSAGIFEAWLQGDVAVIEHEMLQGVLADPELYEALLAGRNRRWVDGIKSLLAEKRHPFIAVGAAHVVGPDGLAKIFEAQGYRVSRLQ